MPNEKGRFFINLDRGFLPPHDPLQKFSAPQLQVLDSIGPRLPDLLDSPGALHAAARDLHDNLNPSAVKGLYKQEQQRAWTILTFTASALVHNLRTDERVTTIPESVAVPLVHLAHELDKPPILAYDSYDLYNWRRIDPDGPIDVENLETLVQFTHLSDETRFMTVHTEIENKAAPALQLLRDGQYAALSGSDEKLQYVLETLVQATGDMHVTQAKMLEGNDPSVYHNKFRPYIMPFKGIIYDGVGIFGGEPQSFRGETGAQSSVMPAFDAAMGVRHEASELTKHTKVMRQYMPKGHRKFIASLEENHTAIRDRVVESGSKLVSIYNAALENMAAFRGQHGEWAQKYIADKVKDPTGTGGTPFTGWLAKLHDETLAARV